MNDSLERKCYVLLLLSLITLTLFSMSAVSGSETRTVELHPVADSYVYVDSPGNNYGKELYLLSDYEDQKIIVDETSFEVPPGSEWIKVTLPINGKIIGSFVVTEGGNRDINFKIANADPTVPPFPRPIYYLEKSRVTSMEFSFVAPYTGNFYLGFDNSFSWFTSKTVSLSDVILMMEPFGSICSPIFLQFDLLNIPPEATINSAILSLAFESSGLAPYGTVDTFYCSENGWSEQSITYANAPFSEIHRTNSYSLNVSGLSVGEYCAWDITPDIVRGISGGKLTEAVVIVRSELPEGWIRFFSRESQNKPKLEISYTYVSVTSSISSTFLIETQNVGVNVNADPSQTVGNIKIQYSADQLEWFDIETFSGGSTHYVWTPPITGRIFVRDLWEISWDGGSYYTLSSVHTLYVIPIYLLVAIPVVAVGIIIGIIYWRRRHI